MINLSLNLEEYKLSLIDNKVQTPGEAFRQDVINRSPKAIRKASIEILVEEFLAIENIDHCISVRLCEPLEKGKIFRFSEKDMAKNDNHASHHEKSGEGAQDVNRLEKVPGEKREYVLYRNPLLISDIKVKILRGYIDAYLYDKVDELKKELLTMPFSEFVKITDHFTRDAINASWMSNDLVIIAYRDIDKNDYYVILKSEDKRDMYYFETLEELQKALLISKDIKISDKIRVKLSVLEPYLDLYFNDEYMEYEIHNRKELMDILKELDLNAFNELYT